MSPYKPSAPSSRLAASSLTYIAGEPDEAKAYDAYLTVNNLLSYRAEHQGHLPFLCDLNVERGTHDEYTVAHIARLVRECAEHFSNVEGLRPRESWEAEQVVGMFGVSWVEYWLVANNERRGHIPFPVSLGLAPSTAAHMLRDAGASFLLIAPGAASFAESLHPYLHNTIFRLAWFSATSQPNLFGLAIWTDDGQYRTTVDPHELCDQPAQFAHTSGSTATPKIVPLKNLCLTQIPPIGGLGDSLIIASPQQGYGTVLPISALSTGKRCYVSTPIPPFHLDAIIDVIRLATKGQTNKIDIFCTYPAMIHRIATSSYYKESLELFRSFDRLVVGGAPAPPAVARWMQQSDLKVCNFMGSLEIGTVFNAAQARVAGWEWFDEDISMSELVRLESLFEGKGSHPHVQEGSTVLMENEGAAELVILPGYPTLQVSNRPDGAYETGDLFLPHPTERGRWRYWRRKDDVVVHSTGMKTDPTYIETQLESTLWITRAFVVGTGFPCAGALIIPSSHALLTDDLIPIVDKINQSVPAQSRLARGSGSQRGTIIILNPDDTFELTNKGMINRTLTERKYRARIQEILGDR